MTRNDEETRENNRSDRGSILDGQRQMMGAETEQGLIETFQRFNVSEVRAHNSDHTLFISPHTTLALSPPAPPPGPPPIPSPLLLVAIQVFGQNLANGAGNAAVQEALVARAQLTSAWQNDEVCSLLVPPMSMSVPFLACQCDKFEKPIRFAAAVLSSWSGRVIPLGITLIYVGFIHIVVVCGVWYLLCTLKRGKGKSAKPGFTPMGMTPQNAEGDATL